MASDILASLSPADQRRLFEHLEAKFEGKEVGGLTNDEIDVFDAIQAALHVPQSRRRSLGLFLGNEKSSKAIGGRKGYAKKAATFIEVIEAGCHTKPSRTRRLAILRVAADCLFDYMTLIGRTPNEPMMINFADHLEQAINDAFPGYIRARMLDRVAAVAA